MKSQKPPKRTLSTCDFERKTKQAHLCGNTRLTEAVDKGDNLAVADILDDRDLKLSEQSLNSALLKSAQEGKRRIAQLLLNRGICVSSKDKIGCLALVAAAEHGYFDIVKLLIDKGVPVDGQDSSGKTALMAAVEKSCCYPLIKYLFLKCKADVNLQDNSGTTVLMLAVESWDFRSVRFILSGANGPCNVDIRNKEGLTAIDLAKRNGFFDLLNVLRQSMEGEGKAPLCVAVANNNLDLVRQLLEIYPPCAHECYDYGEPLPTAMHGLQDEWDGKINCSPEFMDVLLHGNVSVDDCHDCGLTPLMMAASAGSETAVQKLLDHGANVNKYGLKHETALMIAAHKGHAGIMDKLIQAGANVKAEDADDQSVLSWAIKGSHKTCVHLLLKLGEPLKCCDILSLEEHQLLDVLMEVKGNWGQLLKDPQPLQRVLCAAIKSRSYELVTGLIDYGADVNVCPSNDESLCPLFVSLDDSTMLQLLLDKGADVNIRGSPNGRTALMHAALKGNVSIVNMLIDNNADMYAESGGLTALLLASPARKIEVVATILDRGMDVNYVTQTKETALLYALSVKNFALTEMVINRGADVKFLCSDESTVLMYAIKHNCGPNFVRLLIRKGVDVNAQNAEGDTALFHALKVMSVRHSKEIVTLLLEHGADVNLRNLSTDTPLMVAADFSRPSVLKILLSGKATVNAQDRGGNTALHCAVQCLVYVKEKLKLLINEGADVNIFNRASVSPLILAFKNLEEVAVKTLLKFGASVNFQCYPQAFKVWRYVLDCHFMRESRFYHPTTTFPSFMRCLKALFEAGFSFDGEIESNLNYFLCACIHYNRAKEVLRLIQSGAAPTLLNLTDAPGKFPHEMIDDTCTVNLGNCSHTYASTFMIAIMFQQPVVIAIFAQACFYHQTDVKLLQHPRLTEFLQEGMDEWCSKHSLPKLEFCPKNWSLRTWSKLAVMRAIGYRQGREKRVRALPIPRCLQDELLFKHVTIIDQLKKGKK